MRERDENDVDLNKHRDQTGAHECLVIGGPRSSGTRIDINETF